MNCENADGIWTMSFRKCLVTADASCRYETLSVQWEVEVQVV